MASLASLYRQWFDHLLDNFLSGCMSEDQASGDCRHGPFFELWNAPSGGVMVCAGCGLVFSGERESDGVFGLELMRPFAESLS